ncbi:MAG: O-antigen ligase family protein [Chloroflexi bacterium]|nr:O-antigen ligase family protein [Chloroflexota bacterium]
MSVGSLTPSRAILPIGALVAAGAIGAASAVLPASTLALVVATFVIVLALLLATPVAVFALLILAPLSALLSVRMPGVLPADLGQVLLALSLSALIAAAVIRRRISLPRLGSPIMLGLLAFVVAGGISAFSAASLSAWTVEWLKWLLMAAVAAWVIAYRRWEWVLFAVTMAGVANAIVGIWIYFGGSGAEHFLITPGSYRAFGTFEQPNPFAAFMGIVAPVAGAASVGYIRAAWAMRRSSYRSRWGTNVLCAGYYGVASALMLAALVFSWSRGAWLAAGVAGVVVALAMPRRRLHSAVLLAGIVAASVLAIASGRLPASITERVASAFTDLVNVSDVRGADVTPENYAVVERLAHWQAAVEMARLSPVTGVGLGNYEVVYPQVRLMSWKFALGHAHNYYLNVLAETGMIGVLAYAGMWVVFVVVSARARAHPDPLASSIAAGLLGSWTYIIVHSVTDQVFVNYAFLHVGVLIGLAGLLHGQTWKLNRLNPQ